MGQKTTVHHELNRSEYNKLSALPSHPNIARMFGKIGPQPITNEMYGQIEGVYQELCMQTNPLTGNGESRPMLGIILEYHERSLEEYMSLEEYKTSSDRKRIAACQLLDAMSHMHTHGMLHFDLKLDNIRVADDDRVVLVDFGCTIRFPRTNQDDPPIFDWSPRVEPGRAPVGNLGQRAPEVILGINASQTQGGAEVPFEKQSGWAAGVLLYMLITGRHPFDGYPDGGVEEQDLRLQDGIDSILDQGVYKIKIVHY